jgi:hypothetical protein
VFDGVRRCSWAFVRVPECSEFVIARIRWVGRSDSQSKRVDLETPSLAEMERRLQPAKKAFLDSVDSVAFIGSEFLFSG